MQIMTCMSAQIPALYSSNAGDSVVICGDTVFYRIFNDDSFASFDIGKGVFSHKKNGDLIMKERIPLEWESSIMTMLKQNSSKITLKAFFYDGQPAAFANIFLYLDGKEYMASSLNENGIIELDEITSAFIDGKDVAVWLVIVGFETRFNLNVKNNTCYIVQSVYPDCFTISKDKNIKITRNKDGSINLLRGKNKRNAMSLKRD